MLHHGPVAGVKAVTKMAKRRALRSVKKFAAAKKGSEAAETTEVNIGGLITSAVQVLIFVGIIVALWTLTRKAYADQGTEESFNQLVAKIRALDKGRLADGIGHAYYISDKMSLYGFNANSETVKYKGGNPGVEKPGRTAPDGSLGKCPPTATACVCICDKRDCTGFVACNPRIVGDKSVYESFTTIEYFVVKADPKNKFNKGLPITGGSPAISGNFFAIFGDSWKQGKVIFLEKKLGGVIEISFPST